MSQQINLINPALIKQKDFLTTVNISVVYGLFSALMLGGYVYTLNQVSDLTKSKDHVANELTQLQTKLAQMTAARAPREPNQVLLAQIMQLEDKEKVQLQMLEAMNQSKPEQNKSLADYMLGLARQSMDTLWLTGFSINQTNHSVTLRGRTIKADALPNYMEKLGHESVFSGQSFGGLQIKQQVKSEVKPLVAKDIKESHQTASNELLYVEFELQGIEKPSASRALQQTQIEAPTAQVKS